MNMNLLHGAPLYIFQSHRDREFDPDQALYLISSFIELGPVAFQIVAQDRGIYWQVLDLSGRNYSLTTLQTPQVQVKTLRYSTKKKRIYPLYRAKISYQATHNATHPLPMIDDFRATGDPLLAIAQSLSYLQEGEEVRITVIVQAPHKPMFFRMAHAADLMLRGGDLAYHLNQHDQMIEHKRQQEWFATFIAIDVDSPNVHRAIQLRQALDVQMRGTFNRHHVRYPLNGLVPRGYPQVLTIASERSYWKSDTLGWYVRTVYNDQFQDWWSQRWLYLCKAELAALWHLPHKHFKDCRVIWPKPVVSIPFAIKANTSGIKLGKGMFQDRLVDVYLHDSDRDTHATIVGRTGTGKSTAMRQQIEQDIAAGHGVFVIDPHGALVSSILRNGIPASRENDLILLDLADPTYPIPLNLFAGEQSYGSLGRVVDIIDKYFKTSGVQIDKFLRAGLNALQHQPNATMVDFFNLFTDEAYRDQIIQHLKDREAYQALFHDYHDAGIAQQRRIRGPLLNRVSPFISNDYLYPSLCHPDRIAINRWIDQNKIILVSLAVTAEQVPVNERHLVGALLISMLQMVGMNPKRTVKPFYIYIDEVQHFVSGSLEIIFSEARKHGLSMTVAHQHFHQLDTDTLSGILGNVGTLMVFSTNPEDARKLSPYLQPHFDIEQLVNQDRFKAAVKIQFRRENQEAFTLIGEKPKPELANADEREAYLRALSRNNYTPMKRNEVLAWLNQRYGDLRSIRTELHQMNETIVDYESDNNADPNAHYQG